MAGAGFKTFTTGEVLLAADVNTYLMQQTVMVFDDASARATAIPTPSEGMFSYLKDTNLTYRYDGSAWLSDAGTTSPLTTKGDVWGYSTADARIPVGADGTVLTADSAEALGVKWAAGAGTAFDTYTDYTPTYTNFTLGNGTLSFARYAQSGKLVHYYGKIILGSTSSVTGSWETSLPVSSKTSNMGYSGTAFFYDNSAGTSFGGLVYLGSGGNGAISYAYDIASQSNWGIVSTAGPFTWATSDQITWNILYQAA